jgi:predicted RNA-binding Zn ribbon-like protein
MCQTRFINYEFHVPFDALAENLVNSYDNTHVPPEYLRTAQDLREFLERHDLPTDRIASVDLAEVRSLRDQVRRVFEARSHGQAIQEINAMLDRAQVRARLEKSGSAIALDWRVDEQAGVVDRLRSAVALNLALLVERFGLERLRVCVAKPCRDVFVDISKNGARRYCGLVCANRTRVSQFRERQREEE